MEIVNVFFQFLPSSPLLFLTSLIILTNFLQWTAHNGLQSEPIVAGEEKAKKKNVINF